MIDKSHDVIFFIVSLIGARSLKWWVLVLFLATSTGINNAGQGLKLCVMTQSVQLTLSSVQLTLLECAIWSSKMQWRFLTANEKQRMEELSLFQNVLGQCPQTPILGRGYGAPPQSPSPDPIPSALRRFAPPCLARAFGPSIVSLCV